MRWFRKPVGEIPNRFNSCTLRLRMNKDIYKYYCYSALSNFLFFLPIVYIFFKDTGLTYMQIFLIESIFSVGVVLFEVPTGAFADYFERKISILLGLFLWAISCLIFFVGNGFIIFTLAYLIWALGAAFMSGADTALFFEILRSHKKENDFKKYQGTAQLIGLTSLSLASLASGYIASVNMRLTFMASAVSFIVLFFIVASITSKQKADGEDKPQYLKIIKDSFQIIKQSKWILWLFVFSGIFGATFKIIQPLTQIYMQNSHLDIKYFGAASAYFFLIAAIASKLAGGFEQKFKKWIYIVLSLLFVLPIFAISALIFKAGFLIFGMVFFACSITSIITNHEILKATSDSKHATVLSFNNLFYRGIFAIISPIFSYYLGILGLQQTLFIFSIILSAVFMVVLLSYFNIKKEYIVNPKK